MKYLEELLNGATVEWKTLGEVCQVRRGRRITKQELSPEKEYPVYSGGVTPMGYFDRYNEEGNTVTIVKYGTAGYVNYITERFWANDVCYCITPSIILDNKYLFYFLKNNQDYIYSLATDAIPAHLPTENIKSLLIPIPPIEVQRKIVEILDNFAELTAELTAEL
ncbi:MAG: restriction endonuclease subunit S, partial [Porphyromonas sp.]|nr:restriction endonuclease subunit S [Porphyromonas sp.]